MTDTAPRFLVTAGGTREKIDRVRDWGNVFTGNTGYAIARALSAIGHVDLLTSNRDHQREIAATTASPPTAGDASRRLASIPFVSHGDLKAALAALLATHRYAGVFMTAAVSDYAPQRAYEVMSREPADVPGQELWRVRDVHADKVKSAFDEMAVLGQRTEKLVDLFRSEWGYRGLLVKFKLEVGLTRDQLIAVGQSSRAASDADYLVANTLDMVDGPNAGAYLISAESAESADSAEWVARGELPDRLAHIARQFRPVT